MELHMASFFAFVDVVKYLVGLGANLEITDVLGCTALHLASAMGNTEVVQVLIENGANVNTINNDGMTALHSAIQFGRVNVVSFLMECDKYCMMANTNKRTVITLPLSNGQSALEQSNNDGTKVDTSNDDVTTTLQMAMACGHAMIVKDLIKKHM
jgi:ankyrin repeat protein